MPQIGIRKALVLCRALESDIAQLRAILQFYTEY
jgi:hypothetical protein